MRNHCASQSQAPLNCSFETALLNDSHEPIGEQLDHLMHYLHNILDRKRNKQLHL